MSINFNKLFIQDIITRRGSTHALDISETRIASDEEGEAEDSSSDELESIGSEVTNESDSTIGPPISSFSVSNDQKNRLVQVFRELRAAVDRQTVLQIKLNGYQNGEIMSHLEDESDAVQPAEVMTTLNHVSKPRPSSLVVAKQSDDAHSSTTKSTARKRRIASSFYPMEPVQKALADNELSSFRRCERLSKKKERVVVEIRVIFLKIGEIDTLKEIYHADVFIQAKWRETRLNGKTDEELRKIDLQRCWNPLIHIDNILNESKDHHWMATQKTDQNEVYIIERRRLRGIFLETLELNDFPLDVQDLTVTLTSERPDSEVVLVPDKTDLCGINLQTLVDQQEWKLHEHIEVAMRSATQEYTNSSQCHPCISVTCRAARRPGYFYWNVFLIMFFITGLSFATFAVPPERPENRLQLSFTLFLTSVAFKFVINQSLPKISYLTYMDKYVLMSLAILCVISVWHAVVTLVPTDIELDTPVFSPSVYTSTALPLLTYTARPDSSGQDILSRTTDQDIVKSATQSGFINSTGVTEIHKKGVNDSVTSPLLNVTKLAVDTGSQFVKPASSKLTFEPSLFWKTSQWEEIAKRSTVEERKKRKLKQRIEREVFTSFCVLYVLAHLTFLFWLYFDASKRRREMVERDRKYKRCLQASKTV